MSTVERMGSCLRALAVGGVLLVGGAMIAGTAGADGFEAVNTCLDSGNLSLMEADEATVTQSLTQADDASGNMSLTDADERSGNVGMTAIEEGGGNIGLTEADALSDSWLVPCYRQ
jgi:hypothetical protein